MSPLYSYVRSGKEFVEGWFARVDSEIFYELLLFQNEIHVDYAVAEIGVHHGKSFIALCLALRDEQNAYAIDLFDAQEHNLDRSGRGNREAFLNNLKAFAIRQDQFVIDARPSNEVSTGDILNRVGMVRFFSVDGGHWREIVINDLRLAESVLADAGVIALDDFLRQEWPDVSLGFFEWYENSNKEIVPFAIGFNKLYLCKRPYVSRYQNRLEQSAFLQCFLKKHYEFCHVRIPVFQSFNLPESGLRERARNYLKLYHPDFYVTLSRLRLKLRAEV